MNIAVIGAGPIGFAAAGHSTLLGHRVRLYEFPEFQATIKELKKQNTIEVQTCESNGLPTGMAELDYVGTDVAYALKDAETILVAIPAFAEARAAEICAPWLQSGQNIYLFSGGMYGSIQFLKIIREMGNLSNIGVAETNNSFYAARKTSGNCVHIGCYKHGLGMSTFPGKKGSILDQEIKILHPQVELWENMLKTGISNPSVPIHSTAMVFNPRYVEEAKTVMMYEDGEYLSAIGDAICRVILGMDAERMKLNEKGLFGPLKPWSEVIRGWYSYQGVRGETILEIMHSNPGLTGGLLPKTFQHRYLTEDISMGLLPLVELLERCDLPYQTCKSFACLASAISGIDLATSARTLLSLGLNHFSNTELKEYIYEGI